MLILLLSCYLSIPDMTPVQLLSDLTGVISKLKPDNDGMLFTSIAFNRNILIALNFERSPIG